MSPPNIASSKQDHYFSEVIESSLNHFVAQCWQWNILPTFASLVEVHNNQQIILGCVTQIKTESSDPTRKPFAYQKTEAELLNEQPQIFELLKSTFTVHIIGYKDLTTNKVIYRTPLQPSKIHAFVKQTSEQIFAEVFSQPHFLPMFFTFQNSTTNLEELLLAILCQVHQKNLITKEFFHTFYQNFALLNSNDYKRVKLFFERIEYTYQQLEV